MEGSIRFCPFLIRSIRLIRFSGLRRHCWRSWRTRTCRRNRLRAKPDLPRDCRKSLIVSHPVERRRCHWLRHEERIVKRHGALERCKTAVGVAQRNFDPRDCRLAADGGRGLLQPPESVPRGLHVARISLSQTKEPDRSTRVRTQLERLPQWYERALRI